MHLWVLDFQTLQNFGDRSPKFSTTLTYVNGRVQSPKSSKNNALINKITYQTRFFIYKLSKIYKLFIS